MVAVAGSRVIGYPVERQGRLEASKGPIMTLGGRRKRDGETGAIR